MNTFVSAVQNQSARTTNGMRARKSTANKCVDLFFKIGASRTKNYLPGNQPWPRKAIFTNRTNSRQINTYEQKTIFNNLRDWITLLG